MKKAQREPYRALLAEINAAIPEIVEYCWMLCSICTYSDYEYELGCDGPIETIRENPDFYGLGEGRDCWLFRPEKRYRPIATARAQLLADTADWINAAEEYIADCAQKEQAEVGR